MDASKANKIVAAVIAGRKRWGKSYGTGAFTLDDILDALVAQHEAGEVIAEDHSEELVREKRRVTAAKAREGKLRKQNKELQQEIEGLREDCANSAERIQALEEQVSDRDWAEDQAERERRGTGNC